MKSEERVAETRKRRLVLVMPALVVPFLIVIFYILGGGQQVTAKNTVVQQGLKLQLPKVGEKDEPSDKLSYYERADRDSLKLNEMLRLDPYAYKDNLQMGVGTNIENDDFRLSASESGSFFSPGQHNQEEKIYDKIAALQTAINSDQQVQSKLPAEGADQEIDRLEELMSGLNGTEEKKDPEMEQINGMLDRILDIQHPDRVQDRQREYSKNNRNQVFSVTDRPLPESFFVLGAQKEHSSSGFFGLDGVTAPEFQPATAIRAVIHESQTLVNGSVVKMRLTGDVYIAGTKIPKGCFVFGIANLNGERLGIKVENIQFSNRLFPVNLSVYDLDGLAGVHIPNAIGRSVAKQSGVDAFQGLGMGMTSLDPSLAAQAASAGIELTKNFITKKVKLIRVNVKAGYQILLKDENQSEM